MTKTHFYTVSSDLRQRMINEGLADEGIACYVWAAPPANAQVPFFRGVIASSSVHYYSTQIGNFDIESGIKTFSAEGIACYVFDTQVPGSVEFYSLGKGGADDFLYTTSLAETQSAAKAGYALYVDQGVKMYVYPNQVAGSVPLYRMVKTSHFYTTNEAERQNAITALGYKDEGISCYVMPAAANGLAPLYCSQAPVSGGHLYTMSIAERNKATNTLGEIGQGITAWCYPAGQQIAGTSPLLRAYSKASDDHFYTTNVAEHANAVQHLGYQDEGITAYVLTAPAHGATPLYRLMGEVANPPIQ
jgi:Repeat of unknown function (DUF5648)